MLSAEILEIGSRDEKNIRVLDGRCGRWVRAAVKHGKLGKRGTRALNREDLFAPGRRQLENADFAGSDEKQALAWVAFGKKQGSALKSALCHARAEGAQFVGCEVGKQGRFAQRLFGFSIHRATPLRLLLSQLVELREIGSGRSARQRRPWATNAWHRRQVSARVLVARSRTGTAIQQAD